MTTLSKWVSDQPPPGEFKDDDLAAAKAITNLFILAGVAIGLLWLSGVFK